MNKTIAICSNIPDLDAGPMAWRNQDITNLYPGCEWMNHLHRYASNSLIDVISGPEAIHRITKKKLDPSDVYVVQEDLNEFGTYLIKIEKCNPSVVLCLESPLYAPRVYSSLTELKEIFKAQILFGKLGSHQALFPSYDPKRTNLNFTPWEDRTKYYSMVVSNKNVHSQDPRELQVMRFAFIEAFKRGSPDLFDLYGKGWPKEVATEIPPGDKVKTISKYKYNVCLENYSMPGYITEKLIECLEAGCLPVYMGAPDVHQFVPPECFHDPKASREFLESSLGKKFSYQAFASQVLNAVIN